VGFETFFLAVEPFLYNGTVGVGSMSLVSEADDRVHVWNHFLLYAFQKERLQTEKQPGYERDG
jgi:hypothetical protein